MQFRRLGRTEFQVSVMGLGTAEMGLEHVDQRRVDNLLGAACDAGINVIDTAALYGRSEEMIGCALRGRRDKFFIFTKCGLSPPRRRSVRGIYAHIDAARAWMLKGASEINHVSWRPKVLEWNIDQSLRRLKIDRIDLLQLHSCSEQILREGEVIDILIRARDAGKVRCIGYSGDGSAALHAIDSRQFDTLQTSINVADQEAIERILPKAAGSHIGIIAKRPIANGVWRRADRPISSQYYPYWDRLKCLEYDFLNTDHDIETALRFTLSVPGLHTALVGTTDAEHLRRNVRSAALGNLDKDQYEAIRNRWANANLPDRSAQL
jgi:aryl-alcohol dehydrogenase-like predicted oxidoreductase